MPSLGNFVEVSDIDFHKPASWYAHGPLILAPHAAFLTHSPFTPSPLNRYGSHLSGEDSKVFQRLKSRLAHLMDVKQAEVTYSFLLVIVDEVNKYSRSTVANKKQETLGEFVSLIRIELLSAHPHRVHRAAFLADALIKNAEVYAIGSSFIII